MDKLFKNKKIIYIAVAVIVLIAVLFISGILDFSSVKKFFAEKFRGEEIVIEPDAHLMNNRNAYDIALLKAREWQADAELSRINSLSGETGPNGRSDNWDLLFVSKNLKGKGYHIVIRNREISLAEEIQFVGVGGELPENIISSKEAISRAHQVPGYENAEIISVEMIYGPDGKQWYWGVKTLKGTMRINARQ